jgi:uncharacterized protein with HXXEE motif
MAATEPLPTALRGGGSRRTLGVALTAVAIVATLGAMGRVAGVLCVAMAVSCGLWLGGRLQARPRTLPILVVTVGILLLHVGEEYTSGFPRAFPGLLGYQWSDARFLLYNVAWIAVFAAAALGLRHDASLASLAVGFCAIGAGIANGLGHVGLALARGAYFPGLLTAPFCFAAGTALLRSIWRRAGET